MRNLKIKGDFIETSDRCQTFVLQLVEILKENNKDYFRITFKDNYMGEIYGYEHKPIFDKLTKWVSSLKDLNDDNILQDLEENFKDENIVSYMKEYIELNRDRDRDLAPHLEDLRIKYLLKNVEDIEEMSEYDDEIIKTYTFTAHKDLWISDTSDNFSLEIKVLKSNDNIDTNRIEEMLDYFAKGTGEFIVTSIEDKMEFFDIDEIFECPSFETECFGNYAGYDEISTYLNEQLPDGFEIDELEINYIKNR